jgi:hypothetical protein
VTVAVTASPALLGPLLGSALLGKRKAHLVSGSDVSGVGDHHVTGPAAVVAGDGLVVAEHLDQGR